MHTHIVLHKLKTPVKNWKTALMKSDPRTPYKKKKRMNHNTPQFRPSICKPRVMRANRHQSLRWIHPLNLSHLHAPPSQHFSSFLGQRRGDHNDQRILRAYGSQRGLDDECSWEVFGLGEQGNIGCFTRHLQEMERWYIDRRWLMLFFGNEMAGALVELLDDIVIRTRIEGKQGRKNQI